MLDKQFHVWYISTHMETNTNQVQNRRAAVNTLAVVGFVALVFIGMALAVYAARYVPKAVGRIGSAAVGLSQVFSPAATSSLQVVDQPTTVPFDDNASATTTTSVIATTTTVATVPATPVKTYPKPTYTTVPVTVTVPAGGYTGPLFGLPNLVTTITAVGYLDNNDKFVSTKSIPADEQLAVKFTVTNVGTNTTGSWKLHAHFPTKSDSSFDYNSTTLRSLAPKDHIDFTLHLDSGDSRVDSDQEITIDADSDRDVAESNENDNDASISFSVHN